MIVRPPRSTRTATIFPYTTLCRAKGEIFEGLEPGGTAIIPFDSPHHARLRAKAEKHAAHVVGFGFGEGADVRAIDWLSDGKGGPLVTAQVQAALLCFSIAQAGAPWVSKEPALPAPVKVVGERKDAG